ncbi:HNH endonuclease [Nocardioides sp. GCM10027113]|uniref:HNH endonuclease n=1 Tax=unclassified Nocardioides TaxID=2615069 RepID=UPI00360D95A7
MFDGGSAHGSGAGQTATAVALPTGQVTALVDRLAEVPRDRISDADRVELITELERLKAAAAAAQAKLTADLDASQRAEQEAAGLPARRVGVGIAAQVGLARRESPNRGAQHLGLAKVLTTEMPHTLARLTAGDLSEWRATLLARETACLTREHRQYVDQALCADPATLDGLGDRAIVAAAQKLAIKLDQEAVVRRRAKAHNERRVSLRPAPDTMTWLTALLPVEQGVAAFAALTRAAEQARTSGDERGRGQVMADTFVERVTGQALADEVPVAVNLVITETSLFDGDPTPAHVDGYGPVPAAWARDLVAQALDADSGAGAWLRRLFTHPATGALVGMDSRQRKVPAGLAQLVRLRDGGTCRTPWCDAPIRHTDHTTPAHADGPTSEINLTGRCEACNHAKEAPGWRARPRSRSGEPHRIEVTTPTGHQHHSHAPPLPGLDTLRYSTTGWGHLRISWKKLALAA